MTEEERNEMSFILSKWFTLPPLIKSDILRIDISEPTHAKYPLSKYWSFVKGSGNDCYTTKKFRTLKTHLFGADL